MSLTFAEPLPSFSTVSPTSRISRADFSFSLRPRGGRPLGWRYTPLRSLASGSPTPRRRRPCGTHIRLRALSRRTPTSQARPRHTRARPPRFPVHAWVTYPMAAAAGAFPKTLVAEPPINRARRTPTRRPNPGTYSRGASPDRPDHPICHLAGQGTQRRRGTGSRPAARRRLRPINNTLSARRWRPSIPTRDPPKGPSPRPVWWASCSPALMGPALSPHKLASARRESHALGRRSTAAAQPHPHDQSRRRLEAREWATSFSSP